MTRTWILGLLAFLIVCLLCLSCHAPEIVRGKAKAALEAGGFDPDFAVGAKNLGMDGVDLELAGEVSSEDAKQRAGAAVAAVPGVRNVLNGLTIAGLPAGSEAGMGSSAAEGSGAPTATPRPGPLSFDVEEGKLWLAGSVPSEEFRGALRQAARGLWGDDSVVDALFVDGDVDVACWPESFEDFLEAMESRGKGVKVSVSDCRLKIEGTVLSELERQRLVGAFRSALPGLEVDDGLTVREAETEAERVQADLDQLLSSEIVEFATNSDQLTPKGRQVLDRIATILEKTQGRQQISGHTDSSGDAAYNLDLSRRRAESVKAYLVGKGLAADRFEAVGYGETQPIADNSTEEGKRKNRRTEFRALASETQ